MFSSITVVTVNGIKEINAGQGACDSRMGEVYHALIILAKSAVLAFVTLQASVSPFS